jgi:TfoX/Sxy family transcriptional regulator of competence genes
MRTRSLVDQQVTLRRAVGYLPRVEERDVNRAKSARLMKIPKADSRVARIFEELTPTASGVTSKKMFGQPAAFANGNMFMGVFGEDLFVRLSEPDRNEARTQAGFVAFEPMPGRAMSEYWVIPRSVVKNPDEARQWVARSLRYALTLAPKKPKKKPR